MNAARHLLASICLAALAAACSSSSGASDAGASAGTCTDALPSSCPATPPSYQTDVLPILRTDCVSCHSPTGTAGYDESTYAEVYAQRSPILDQVNGCMMPPANGPAMSEAQRSVLLQWLVCGAPNN